MPKFSTRSRTQLESCHPDLQAVFNVVVETYDCSILEGHRGEFRQNHFYETGLSKVKFPDGGHNKLPSNATDAVPYPIPERWGSHPNPKVLAKFYHFAGYVLGVAQQMGVALRWGGDWDGDHDFRDQTFDDLVHFELK